MKPFLVPLLLFFLTTHAQKPWIAHDSTGSFRDTWGSLNDSNIIAKALDDGYHVNATGGTAQYLSRHYTLDQKHDFKIEATFRLTESPDENSGFGLFFGGGESYKQGYEFIIARNGNYAIGQVTYAGYNKIEVGNSKGAVCKGPQEINKLTMMRREGYWTFCINDVEMTTRQTYPFAGDRFGFFLDAKTGVVITSFKIYDWTLAAGLPLFEKEPVCFVKLYDHFYDNKNEWALTNNDEVGMSISGSFSMNNKTDGTYCVWSSATLGTFFENYSLETELVHNSGVDDWGYGLTYGLKDFDNRFVFFISADGSAKISKRENGNWYDIMKWTKFDVIHKGDYGTNHLEIRKINGWWSFYINHQLIYSCQSQPFFGNNFGLYTENKQRVTMNYVKVAQLYFPKE